jgi:hypothetical protein
MVQHASSQDQARTTRPALTAAVILMALAVPLLCASPASAQAVYWDKASILKDFFASSERVSYKRFTLTESQRAAAASRLGTEAPATYTVYYGTTRGHVDGFAVIDEEPGQHLPITFGVLIGTDGAVKRLEIMVYREAYGDEVREARFRRQFAGKTAGDPVRHGQDVVAVSGATISSKAMATGTRRALALVDLLVLKPGFETLVTAAAP